MKLDSPWLLTIVVFICFLGISVLSRISTGVRQPVARETLNNSNILLKASNQWAMSSEQDRNPLIALMHICYAKAYARALRKLLNDDQIFKAHNVDMQEREQKMDSLEQKIMSKLLKQYPNLLPDGNYAVHTGWL